MTGPRGFGVTWVKGDRVVHGARPEWGPGEVLQADAAVQDGKACQRLIIRFQRAGMKTISTAFADLARAGDAALSDTAPETDHDPLAAAATNASVEEAMLRLPENATDPFISTRKRVEATLNLYKYGESNGGLLDWAAIQTGLKDPLSRFNRHELERWWERFRILADDHLKKLLRELRKQDPKAVDEIAAAAGPAAKRALRQAEMGR